MKRIARYLHIGMLLSAAITSVKAESTVKSDCCTTSSTSTSCCDSSSSCCNSPKTVFIPMSIGTDLSKQYHEIRYLTEDTDCCYYLDGTISYSYYKARNTSDIASHLFGTSNLKFAGSAAAVRSPNETYDSALVADYFGFNKDSDFSICLSPKIINHKIDLELALGGEKCWFQVNAPIVYSKFDIHDCCDPRPNGSLGEGSIQESGKNGTLSGSASVLTYQTEGTASPITLSANNDATGYTAAFASNYTTDLGTPSWNAIFTEADDAPDSFIGDGEMGSYGSLKVNGSTGPVPQDGKTNNFILNTTSPGNGVVLNLDQIKGASSVAEGLGGYEFGNLTRTYNKFNFSNSSCKSEWKLADLNLQLGYDFYKCDNKHFGLYLRAIIPTGTSIDQCFAKNVLSPVIGNGKHFELGAGLSAHAELWNCENSCLLINLDGYITHMFGKNQFRTFDRSNDPMSRYSVVKQLTLNEENSSTTTSETQYNDKYVYNYVLKPLGDFNNQCVDVSCDIKGEFVIDLVYSRCNWTIGGGYSFAGQSKEKICGCDSDCDSTYIKSDGKYYGFKTNTGEDNLTFYSLATGEDEGFLRVGKKSSGNVMKNGASQTKSAYTIGQESYTNASTTVDADVFQLADVNRSGLMEGQILNRIFGHIDYVWADCCWMPQVGIMGSFGWSPDSYKTAEYWDIGARLGFSY